MNVSLFLGVSCLCFMPFLPLGEASENKDSHSSQKIVPVVTSLVYDI